MTIAANNTDPGIDDRSQTRTHALIFQRRSTVTGQDVAGEIVCQWGNEDIPVGMMYRKDVPTTVTVSDMVSRLDGQDTSLADRKTTTTSPTMCSSGREPS